MAFSSLKSTSRRGTRYSTKPSSSAAKDQSCLQPRRKNPIRRPRSVSAASRSYVNGAAASPAAKKSSVSQFSNTRDNPLFSCSSSSSSEGEASEPVFEFGGGDSNGGRGRLVSRSSGNVEKTASNRSQSALILSRVSSGRLLRSTSIERFGYSMSKEEKDYRKTSILRVEDKVACSPKVMKDSGTTLEGYDAMKQTKNLQTWRSKHSVSDYFNALSVRSWEDGISTSSLSDLEVKTMRKNECRSAGVEMDYLYEIVRSEVHRAVSEIKCNLENAIRTNNFTVNAFDHALEMPPQLVNIDAVDCRAEYETMLKESQERAKKLRADLAVEEQHELEIDKILKGISLKETSSQKSKQRKLSMERLRADLAVEEQHELEIDKILKGISLKETSSQKSKQRKLSMERLETSKQLTEDAMNYFDECVSITTFDSSDLSSAEDQKLSSGGIIDPMDTYDGLSTSEHSKSTTPCVSLGCSSHLEQLENQTSNFATSIGGFFGDGSLPVEDLNPKKPSDGDATVDDFGFHDLRNFLKKFEKSSFRSDEHLELSSSFNIYGNKEESLLLDTVIFRNRIESGSLLLCHGRTL
ncbi:hypothetical protein HPP92_026465 [Vanilla planifolia]|uniref:Uncharacterized protein n=2 Tax=Vanilla planifolia TaxID=51239 RepID=A0A835PDF8_VANPL|nr:hypothetical protein HPP92_026465 [Vanilla planifolia]